MKGICPNCEKETDLEFVRTKETIDVRGEPIQVDVEYAHCNECGVDFENTEGVDYLASAYEKYRHQHGMLQPGQIRDWRKQQGLTQGELCRLLGWGDVTLTRYENGALHSESHEKILRLAMEPHNLIKLIEEAPEAISIDKRERLLDELRAADEEACSFERLLEQFGQYEPDEFSGYRKFDLGKLYNTILFFTVGGTLKTKLNKLLFYADFKHFKEYSVSITGAKYVHLQYGPVPDDYDYYFAELSQNRRLNVVEEQNNDYTYLICQAREEPDMSMFSKSEKEILQSTLDFFKDYGSVKIMNFSHEETAYKSTRDGEKISYQYAKELRV